MVDLIIGLIVLAIVLAFITRWIRSSAARNLRPVAGRPMPRGPRDIAESGGYQAVPRTRKEPAIRFPLAERSMKAEAPVPLSRSAAVPISAAPQGITDAQLVRRSLATPETLRTTILLKEIMDPPVSMKERGR